MTTCVLVDVRVGVAVPDRVLVRVGVGLRVAVGVADCEGDVEPEGVVVCEGLCDCDGEDVPDGVADTVGVRLWLRVVDCERVLACDTDCVCVGLGDCDSVNACVFVVVGETVLVLEPPWEGVRPWLAVRVRDIVCEPVTEGVCVELSVCDWLPDPELLPAATHSATVGDGGGGEPALIDGAGAGAGFLILDI